MGDFLERLFEKIRELWPFEIVHSYEQGIKFRLGHDVAELPAGMWFRLWFVDEIHTVPIAEQTKELPIQSLTTADGVAITFSVNIVYKITHARQMYVSVHDFDMSLEAAAMIHLSKHIRTKAWTELREPEEIKKLEKSLEGRLTTKLTPWGVEVVDVGVTNLCATKAWRLFGSTGIH